MKNKNNWYWLAIYAIVVALYNFAFTFLIVAIISAIVYFAGWEIIGLGNFYLFSYSIGYIILFIGNISVLKEYVKKQELEKEE